MHDADRVERNRDPLVHNENPLWYDGVDLGNALLAKIWMTVAFIIVLLSIFGYLLFRYLSNR